MDDFDARVAAIACRRHGLIAVRLTDDAIFEWGQVGVSLRMAPDWVRT